MEYIVVGNKAGNASESTLEKRRMRRRRVNLWVNEARSTEPFTSLYALSRVLDLSPHGAFVVGTPLKMDSTVELKFMLPNRMKSVFLKARVVRSRLNRTDTNPFHANSETGIGIEFTEISNKDREAISDFLYSRAGEQTPNEACEGAKNGDLDHLFHISANETHRDVSTPKRFFSNDEIEDFLDLHLET